MRNSVTLMGIGLSLAFAGPAAAKPFPQNKDGTSTLSVQDYYDRITVDDDEMEVTAKFTTENGYKEGRNFGRAYVKKYVRAFKDKSSGDLSYQFYIFIENKKQFVNPVQANYGKPVKAHKVRRLDFDVQCYSGSKCDYYEVVTFPLTDAFLSQLKANNAGSKMDYYGGPATFRLKTKAGVNINLRMAEAEILAAVYFAEKYE